MSKDGAFYLSSADVRTLREVIRQARGGKTSRRPVPLRRRPMGGGARINIVHGEAVGAVDAVDATFDIDQVQLINGGLPNDVDAESADTIEVSNPFGFAVDDNGLVRAEQATDGTWYAVQAECPA